MTPDKDHKYVVVTIAGRDRPGITAAFTRILVEHGVEVAGIDQATLQDFLALTLLLELGPSDGRTGVLKDLLFEANHLEMNLQFQLLSENDLQRKRAKNLFVLAFFGDTSALADITRVLGEEDVNIEKMSNLRTNGGGCLELIININKTSQLPALKERLLQVSHERGVDLAFQRLESYRRGKRLVLFDMDDTLIDMEVIDEMARAAGVHHEVARVTEKAMRGELDFAESLKHRVALLKGLRIDQMEKIRDGMELSVGAEKLVKTLKKLGYKVGVVSGGFMFFAVHLADRLGMDFARANQLEIKDGVVTGRLIGDILDGAGKAKVVHSIADEMGILLDQTVAIGDGANDSLMLGQAGLGIAYNAKGALDQVAGGRLGKTRLTNILHILGIGDELD